MKRAPLLLFSDPTTGELVRRRWQLHVVDGPDAGLVLELTDPQVLIGASPAAKLFLSDSTVSLHHLEINAFADGLRLHDLDSTNGTFLGRDERIRDTFVTPQETFRVGLSTIRVVALDEAAASEIDTDPRGIPAPGEIEQLGTALGVAVVTRELLASVRKVASSTSPVLFYGGPGSGKTTFARALHELSPRRNRAFVTVDLRDKDSFTIETELFGSGDTKAGPSAKGAFEEADHGTLFLKDVGVLTPGVQMRVQKTLEQGELRRSGDKVQRRVNVRLVSSLEAETAGRPSNLEDEFFRRISVVRVHVPSLSDRRDDIPALANRFLVELGHPKVEIGRRAIAILETHPFERNLAELRAAIARALEAEPHEGHDETPLVSRLRRALAADVVMRTRGDVSQAAERLSFTKPRLFRLLEEEGVDLEDL